jgi:hypothetical protein
LELTRGCPLALIAYPNGWEVNPVKAYYLFLFDEDKGEWVCNGPSTLKVALLSITLLASLDLAMGHEPPTYKIVGW